VTRDVIWREVRSAARCRTQWRWRSLGCSGA